MLYFEPHYGQTQSLVYLGICSLMGSMTITVDDVYLSFLPLAHILDRMGEEYFFHSCASSSMNQQIHILLSWDVFLAPLFTETRNSIQKHIHNGIVIVWIDAPIYFANTSFIKERVSNLFCGQIAISNPNPELVLAFANSALFEQIGKDWFFVRIHDVVQVCLQHVQSLKGTLKVVDSVTEKKSSFLLRLNKQQENYRSNPELELCNKETQILINTEETVDK